MKEWRKKTFIYSPDGNNIVIVLDSDEDPATKGKLLAHLPIPNEINLRRLVGGDGTPEEKSYRDGGRVGDSRYVPLGNGVFVETYRTPHDGVYYHG
ncbi:hypothetical protein WDW86_21320 [Bdellovibrionota bacterium FG-2]